MLQDPQARPEGALARAILGLRGKFRFSVGVCADEIGSPEGEVPFWPRISGAPPKLAPAKDWARFKGEAAGNKELGGKIEPGAPERFRDLRDRADG